MLIYIQLMTPKPDKRLKDFTTILRVRELVDYVMHGLGNGFQTIQW